MTKNQLKKGQGFTLIEVVIVLAIAALIILVVLQAVSAAQKSQRDNTRKQEAGRMVSLLEQYASNNGGVYPTSASGVSTAIATYDSALSSKYSTSSDAISGFYAGGTYNASAATWHTANTTQCSGSNLAKATTYRAIYTPSNTTSPRDYDLGTCLEAGDIDVVHPSQ